MILVLFFCLIGFTYGTTEYSDDFARNYMFPLSAASYSDDPEQCLNRLFPNSTLQRQVVIQCDSFRKDTCSGYTAVLHNEKAIVLSFRGTIRFWQLFEEIEKSVFVNWSNWLFGGRISKYFHDGFQKIWDAGMSRDYFALKNKYPEYQIWVTGHSLGGSMASLAASFLIGSEFAKPSEIKLITFGQPRTGDLQFSITHNTQLEYSFRVTHWRDIVPHIPFEIVVHYFHHRSEAFYRYNMTADSVTVCSGSEDRRCSDGLWFTGSIAEHRNYFGKDVYNYGFSNCV
ncbi:triacylglycerol lipase [Dictyocaulus viviparus]|uniref:Triacylglycerol lipase n=1 Tax=Dictyocaulus viviparus TaxID=29172 RepID=A0A0D8XSH1_DICVI|nr:triacylglycerol lipase [Dictyocaulus viviparus]